MNVSELHGKYVTLLLQEGVASRQSPVARKKEENK
jgi:hypothetical protein